MLFVVKDVDTVYISIDSNSRAKYIFVEISANNNPENFWLRGLFKLRRS